MIFYILPLNREARDLKPQMQMYLFLSFFQMRCFQNMLQKLTCTVATYLFPLYVIWAVWQSSGKGGLMQTLWQRTLGKISTLKKKRFIYELQHCRDNRLLTFSFRWPETIAIHGWWKLKVLEIEWSHVLYVKSFYKPKPLTSLKPKCKSAGPINPCPVMEQRTELLE